jgi:hypothetical protein
MKVKISNYSSRWISEVHTRYMNKKYGRYEWDDNKDWKDRVWERVEDALQWLYNHTINLILDKRSSQRVNVRIDYWDTWSADHTLAYIITPILKKLRESKQGAPWVDDEDVPEELRSTSAPPKENEHDLDDNYFKRWDWVLDEMIWAFEMLCKDNWESDYYEYESDPTGTFGLKLVWDDREGKTEADQRIQNGLVLFGKYYRCLWD